MISNATSKEELNNMGINSDMYIKEIKLIDHDNIRYLNDNDSVIEGDITVDDDNIMKENLTLLKKKINSVKKDMGLNWFDSVSLKLKKDAILESYQEYLEKLYIKYKWYNEDLCDSNKFNDWNFIISKET